MTKKSNPLLMTLYCMNDAMLDIVDEVPNVKSLITVSTKNGSLSSSDAAKIKAHFNDSYASRATLTKIIWEYIKDNGLNNGRTIKLDKLLKKLAKTSASSVDMMKVASMISNGIDAKDVVKV